MAYELRDNSGSLFENDKKTADKHPDFKGKVMIAGVTYWISAWTKNAGRGDFFSLSFQPVEEQGGQRPVQQTTQRSGGYGTPAPQQVSAVRRPQRAEGSQNAAGSQEEFTDDSIPF